MRYDLAWKIFEVFNFSVCEHKLDHSKMEIYFNDQLFDEVGFHLEYIDDVYPYRRTSVIYLSIRCLDNPERLRDTLLHELCHATVWQIDEIYEEDDHGPQFKWWIQHLGHNHPYIDMRQVEEEADFQGNEYLYQCIKCGYDIGENKPLARECHKSCMRCGGRFSLVELQDHKLDSLPPH